MLKVSVIIHVLNEEINLPFALKSVADRFDQVFVVDAGSVDRTKEIVLGVDGVEFVQIEGDRTTLVKQRNWALENLKFRNDWVYILDADESVPDDLYREMKEALDSNNGEVDGYWVRYKDIILERWLKYSNIYPNWNLRLFKHDKLRYEDRSVNAHVKIENDRSGWLKSHFVHNDRRGFGAQIKRLSGITVVEAKTVGEIYESGDYIKSSLFSSSPVERRRAMKKIYYGLPFRPLIIFFYLYVVKLGFLEGKRGLYFTLFRAFQEMLINILKYENEINKSGDTFDGN